MKYDQDLVNDSLENTLDIEPMNNNQEPIKKGRGGKREGAGRRSGSTNKIQGGEFLEEYKKTGFTHSLIFTHTHTHYLSFFLVKVVLCMSETLIDTRAFFARLDSNSSTDHYMQWIVGLYVNPKTQVLVHMCM